MLAAVLPFIIACLGLGVLDIRMCAVTRLRVDVLKVLEDCVRFADVPAPLRVLKADFVPMLLLAPVIISAEACSRGATTLLVIRSKVSACTFGRLLLRGIDEKHDDNVRLVVRLATV